MRPQPRVRNKKAHEHSHHGHTGNTRHSPRNGFTAYFVLSPAIGLVVTVICASSRRLDASVEASEPHDFAVRFSAIRKRRRRVHRIPRSTSVTIAKRPSEEAGRPTYITDLGQPASEISEIQKLTAALCCGMAGAAVTPRTRPGRRNASQQQKSSASCSFG